MIVIESFSTLWEAGMAKSILEAEGIPAYVDQEVTSSMGVNFTMQGGIRLLVPEEFQNQAAEVLEEWRRSATEVVHNGDEDETDEGGKDKDSNKENT